MSDCSIRLRKSQRVDLLQVYSVLESLEREYKRDEDWCCSDKTGQMDKATLISQLINKHQEQKEAFLKVTLFAVSLVFHFFKTI